jgi:hypothetical protein
VDGEEVNRFIGPNALWQLHPDATPAEVSFHREAGRDRFQGSHAGYQRLPSPVRITRAMALATGRPLVAVADTVEGAGSHVIEWRFPLDAGVRAEIEGADVRLVRDGHVRWLLPATPPPGAWSIEPGWVSASYGVRRETQVLTLRSQRQLPQQMTYLFTTERRSEAERRADAGALLVH